MVKNKKEVAAWEKLSKGIKFSPAKTQRKPRKPRVEENIEASQKEEEEE